MNKPSGGDGITAELFKILKDDAMKVLHSVCQQIWKTQQWPQDWKSSVFIKNPMKGQCQRMLKLLHNCTHLTHQQGEGNGNPLQYSCLENLMDRGAWWAAVNRVAQSRTQLKQFSIHACIGEGNSNPLQYYCLENPRDRGAWWAAIYGVAQSCT